jgi:hypothetical protein
VSYSDAEARDMVAAVKKLHFEYLPVHVEFTTCAHCNTLKQFPDVAPWPCPTVWAMTTAVMNHELAQEKATLA